jgi:hypothetical protein
MIVGDKKNELIVPEGLRRCSKCDKLKPADTDHFVRNNARKDGLMPICKDCRAKAQRAYRERKRNAAVTASEVRTPPPARESGAREQNAAPVEVSPAVLWCAAEACLLNIDLTDYPEIYQEIERIARDEDRTPELQVRHLLRKMFGEAA